MSAVRLDSKPAPILKGKRIIFVLGSLELGGAERQALILAKYLSEQEQAIVEVWGFNHSGPVNPICEEYGLAWRVVPYPFSATSLTRLVSLSRLAWMLRRARPDILLSYTMVPNVACGLVWKWTGAQTCVWNQRDEGFAPFGSELEYRALKRITQFISNSQQGARFLIDKLKVSPARVVVINNGVNSLAPKMSRSAWRDHLEVKDQTFVACMVANLHKNKDHQTLLRAWRDVVTSLEENGRNAVLLLAGRYDDSYESLVALSRELSITNSVRFLGHVSDIAGLLGAVDISILSSRSEGCPNGVLESMACGLAVAGNPGPCGCIAFSPTGRLQSTS
jgi:glycosyltransferase involved in cell wall biosynthesis